MFKYFLNELRTNTGLASLLSLFITAMSGIIAIYLTKKIEIEKYKQQLLFEKKYNAYIKYLEPLNECFNKLMQNSYSTNSYLPKLNYICLLRFKLIK